MMTKEEFYRWLHALDWIYSNELNPANHRKYLTELTVPRS